MGEPGLESVCELSILVEVVIELASDSEAGLGCVGGDEDWDFDVMVVEQPWLERRWVGGWVGMGQREANECPDHGFGGWGWDVKGVEKQGTGLEGKVVIGLGGLLIAGWEKGEEEA